MVTALHFIRGPNVNDWVEEQLTSLTNKVTAAVNPIPHDRVVLWNDSEQAFRTAFTDTTKEQLAHAKLFKLKMRPGGLDNYITTFKHLAKQAGYDLGDKGLILQFVRNLDRGLAQIILHREQIPTTFAEWETSTRKELQLIEQRHAWFEPERYKYVWVMPKCLQGHNGHHRRHPNDETIPMDVDPPVFTRVNCTYTDEDKHHYIEQGLYFKCGKKGHQARLCPDQKKQPFKLTQHPKKGTFTPHPSKQSFKQRSYPPKCTKASESLTSLKNILI